MHIIPDIPGGRLYRRDRSPYWYYSYRGPDGRKIRGSTGCTDETAAAAQLRKVYEQRTNLTFREAAVQFFDVKSRTLSPKTLQGYRTSLRALDPFFGSGTLSEIDHEALKRFVSVRRQSVSDVAVRRDLAFLSTLISFAQRETERGPSSNPLLSFSKCHLKENRREIFLTPEEFDRMEKACVEEWHRVVLRVAVHTGLRHSELRHLSRKWIRWEGDNPQEIHVPKEMTKSRRPRVIPVLPELADTLKDWCARTSGDLLFTNPRTGGPYGSFDGFFTGLRRRAGVKSVRIHDLRHTFASWWVQRGGDLMVLRDLLGHTTMTLLERYAHLDTGAAHRAVRQLRRTHSGPIKGKGPDTLQGG